mmetsp:Transcript_1604/g.4239  ORF Transcript_1604/g.4239 Transcript_1604/m.4239 type:complete len:100 (+) Transcript_1604:103-402(+)
MLCEDPVEGSGWREETDHTEMREPSAVRVRIGSFGSIWRAPPSSEQVVTHEFSVYWHVEPCAALEDPHSLLVKRKEPKRSGAARCPGKSKRRKSSSAGW